MSRTKDQNHSAHSARRSADYHARVVRTVKPVEVTTGVTKMTRAENKRKVLQDVDEEF